MTKYKIVYLTIIIALVFFILGLSLAYFMNFSKNNCDNMPSTSFDDGWNSAVKRVKESNVCEIVNEDIPIFSLAGEIKIIGNNKVSIEIIPFSPFEKPDLDSRDVLIDGGTKIFQVYEIKKEEYEKIMEDFYKKRDQYANEDEFFSNRPDDKIKKEININDLAVGQKLIVVSEKNIRNVKSVAAKEITIQ